MAEPSTMHLSLPVAVVRQFLDGDEDELRSRLRRSLGEVPPYSHALFFGCVDDLGHYLWGANAGGSRRPLRVRRDGQDALLGKPAAVRKVPNEPQPLVPWGLGVDGGLMPKQRGLQQGEAILAQEAGWTALSFWDRTVDTRPGSVSVYLFNAVLEFHQAVKAAMAEFPTIWERYPFDVTPAP